MPCSRALSRTGTTTSTRTIGLAAHRAGRAARPDRYRRQANKRQNRTTGHNSLGGCQLVRAGLIRGIERSQTPNWVRVSSACMRLPSWFQSSEPLLATYSNGNRYLAARRRRANRDWSRSSSEWSNQLTSDRTSWRLTDDKSETPRRDQMSGSWCSLQIATTARTPEPIGRTALF
jgi:hypothetical protein